MKAPGVEHKRIAPAFKHFGLRGVQSGPAGVQLLRIRRRAQLVEFTHGGGGQRGQRRHRGVLGIGRLQGDEIVEALHGQGRHHERFEGGSQGLGLRQHG